MAPEPPGCSVPHQLRIVQEISGRPAQTVSGTVPQDRWGIDQFRFDYTKRRRIIYMKKAMTISFMT